MCVAVSNQEEEHSESKFKEELSSESSSEEQSLELCSRISREHFQDSSKSLSEYVFQDGGTVTLMRVARTAIDIFSPA